MRRAQAQFRNIDLPDPMKSKMAKSSPHFAVQKRRWRFPMWRSVRGGTLLGEPPFPRPCDPSCHRGRLAAALRQLPLPSAETRRVFSQPGPVPGRLEVIENQQANSEQGHLRERWSSGENKIGTCFRITARKGSRCSNNYDNSNSDWA